MAKSRKRGMGKCPSCGEYIFVGDRPRIHQLITCRSCEDQLEIIRLDPIILDWSYIPNEDSYYFAEELDF